MSATVHADSSIASPHDPGADLRSWTARWQRGPLADFLTGLTTGAARK